MWVLSMSDYVWSVLLASYKMDCSKYSATSLKYFLYFIIFFAYKKINFFIYT